MKAPTANLINAATLIIMGLWGYFGSESPSPTAFIPSVAGVLLLLMHNGVKTENKVIAHIAVVLTLLMILALAMPLKGALGREDTMAIVRIAIMIITGILAMVAFIGSFKAARKAREAAAANN